MTRPEWMPNDAGGLVAELIATAESCGITLACLPHLRAVAEELMTGKPSASVDAIMHDAWRPTLTAVMALVPALTADAIVLANGPRLYGAMIVLLEAMTQRDPDAYDHAKAILNDVGELPAVLLDMQTARRAREQEKIAASAAVPVPPALAAEIEKIDRLVVDDLTLSLPLPMWAELQRATDVRTVTYMATAELAHLGALYRAWAPSAGWLHVSVLDNDRFAAFELQRDGIVVGVRLNPWINGRIQISVELPRPLAATVVPGKRPVATMKLPPVTRERLPAMPTPLSGPLDQPSAVLADGGLVFVANEYDVWMIDPGAWQKTRVASNQGVRMRALVPDGKGLLGLSSTPVTFHGIGTGAAPIVVDDRSYGIALARVGATAFIACDDGRMIVVTLPSGERLAEIGVFTKDLRALTSVDGVVYALDGRVISSIDPTTYEVKTVIELPKAASAITTDGRRIYTLHGQAIGSYDIESTSFAQCAGQPNFGAMQILAAGGGAARDGVGEGAVIESARFLSHDGGNLWFTDGARLRRFEIKAMHTRTLELG